MNLQDSFCVCIKDVVLNRMNVKIDVIIFKYCICIKYKIQIVRYVMYYQKDKIFNYDYKYKFYCF